MTSRPGLSVDGLTVRYGSTDAVRDVSIDVPAGSVLALVGPSGCGKTTILRAVAGLVDVAAGEIRIGDRDVTRVSAARRNVGLVPQSYAMFPHMSVAANVAYGLRARRTRRDVRERRVAEVLDLVHLTEYAQRRPAALSGGQRQRVALARALAVDPALLLLDEPLSALDPQLRGGLRRSLADNLARAGCTTVIVTHDQQEALALGHTIAVVRAGEVVQVGTPAELWNAPADEFVADFLGSGRMLPARRVGDTVHLLDGRWVVPVAALDAAGSRRGDRVLVRRDSLVPADPAAPGAVTAVVRNVEFAGSHTRLRLDLGGVELDLDHPGVLAATPTLTLAPRPGGIVLL